MYPIRAVAVACEKRLRSGLLTDQQFLRIIRVERPEMALLTRFEWPGVLPHVRAEYEAIPFADDVVLYVRPR